MYIYIHIYTYIYIYIYTHTHTHVFLIKQNLTNVRKTTPLRLKWKSAFIFSIDFHEDWLSEGVVLGVLGFLIAAVPYVMRVLKGVTYHLPVEAIHLINIRCGVLGLLYSIL